MLQMNYWTDKWDLHEDICPCDVHVNEWIAEQGLKNKVDLPFRHRHASRRRPRAGRATARGNSVLAITASIEEYEAYIKLVSDQRAVSRKPTSPISATSISPIRGCCRISTSSRWCTCASSSSRTPPARNMAA